MSSKFTPTPVSNDMALSKNQDIRQSVKSGFIDLVRVAEDFSKVSEINSRNAYQISALLLNQNYRVCVAILKEPMTVVKLR